MKVLSSQYKACEENKRLSLNMAFIRMCSWKRLHLLGSHTKDCLMPVNIHVCCYTLQKYPMQKLWLPRSNFLVLFVVSSMVRMPMLWTGFHFYLVKGKYSILWSQQTSMLWSLWRRRRVKVSQLLHFSRKKISQSQQA